MSLTLAADIGTTTVELALLSDNQIISRTGFLNPQRLYGSDVLSRTKNASKPDLAALMQDQIRSIIHDTAISSLGLSSWKELSLIILSGNTLMLHLFFGFDVSGMTDAPFEPFTLEPPVTEWDGIRVLSFPCISAFVGGDITSGIYALSIPSSDKNILFADLGTNGEILLKLNDRLFSTSVAVGPAFEGGNISIGMPAIDGAIDSVSIKKGFCRIHTVSELLPPKGICGSGLIDTVYELRKEKIIDKFGSFYDDTIRHNGFCIFAKNINDRLILTQDDIRSLQAAKAAVYAGILTLLDITDTSATDIDQFYIAGSFGKHLDIKKASDIKMIPEALIPKTSLAGNTSLEGAIRLADTPSDLSLLSSITRKVNCVSLADSEAFRSAYIQSMDL